MGCEICYDFDRSILSRLHRSRNLKKFTFDTAALDKSIAGGCQGCETLLDGIVRFYANGVTALDYYLECSNPKSSVFLTWKPKHSRLNIQQTVPEVEALEFYFLEDAFLMLSVLPVVLDLCGLVDSWWSQLISGHIGNQECSDLNVGFNSVTPVLDLAHAVKWIEKCLQTCDTFHTACLQPASKRGAQSASPARLLELRKGDTEFVYLNDTNTEPAAYMTLSHCWGSYQPMKTTLATYQQRKEGIIISDLPRTFRDAIQITQQLGVQYLWIDSLCIIQDDGKDWNIESAKMATIYSGSFLNLSATQSSDGTGGCLGRGRERNRDEAYEVQIPKAKDLRLCVRPETRVRDSHGDLQNMSLTRKHEFIKARSPLLSRAWAFQERLLSPRNVNFHREEMVFECTSSITCECGRIIDSSHQRRPVATLLGSATIPGDGVGRSSMTDSRRRQWYKLVRQYSGLSIAYARDRLPAIAGLAKNFSLLLDDQYIAGLWKQDLWYGLQWRVISENKYILPRRAAGRAPTWSWPSIEYQSQDMEEVGSLPQPIIAFDGWSCDRAEQKSIVISVECQPLAPESPFGATAVGVLTIEAKCLELQPIRTRNDFHDQFEVKFADSKAPHRNTLGTFVIDVNLVDTGLQYLDKTLGQDHTAPGAIIPHQSLDSTGLRCVSMGFIRNMKCISRNGGREGRPVSCLTHKCLLIRQIDPARPEFERIALGTVDDHEGLFAAAKAGRFVIV